MLRQREKNGNTPPHDSLPVLTNNISNDSDSDSDHPHSNKKKYGGLCALLIIVLMLIYWISFTGKDSSSTTPATTGKQIIKEFKMEQKKILNLLEEGKPANKIPVGKGKHANLHYLAAGHTKLKNTFHKKHALRVKDQNQNNNKPLVGDFKEISKGLKFNELKMVHGSMVANTIANQKTFGIVEEKSLIIKMPSKILPYAGTVFVRYTEPPKDITMKTHDFILIFLHGQQYSSHTWSELGTLYELAQKGYICVAIDIPYYGKSKAEKGIPRSKMVLPVDNEWLIFVIKYLLNPPTSPFNIIGDANVKHKNDIYEKLRLTQNKMLHVKQQMQNILHGKSTSGIQYRKFILVTPSMSGKYSMPMLAGDEREDQAKKLLPFSMIGCITVAPVFTEQISVENFKKVSIPVEIVYGELDRGLGLQSQSRLKNIPQHKIDVINGGKHACYLDNRQLFHQIIVKYLNEYFSGKSKSV